MRALILTTLLLGCGGRVLDEQTALTDAAAVDSTSVLPATDTSAPADVAPPAPTDAGPGPMPADTGAPTPPTSLAECFGEMGKSNPSTLKDLFYNYSTCPGDMGCFWRFRFNVGCSVELELTGSMLVRGATVYDEDCTVLRNWATSERFLGALHPDSPEAKACYASSDKTRGEDTSVGGTPYGLKTFYCPVEPFTTHRRCMQQVIAKYFPPK